MLLTILGLVISEPNRSPAGISFLLGFLEQFLYERLQIVLIQTAPTPTPETRTPVPRLALDFAPMIRLPLLGMCGGRYE